MFSPRRLQIIAVADAVLSQTLDLTTHHRFANELWLAESAERVQMICQNNPTFSQTENAFLPFLNYFLLVHKSVAEGEIRQILTMIRTAIDSGYFIATVEQKFSWAAAQEQPSAEAETLLALTSGALEREILRKWEDPHTALLRTVALMYGYLLGRNGVDATLRSINGEYHNKWVFTS